MIRSHLPPSAVLSEAKEMLGPGTDSTGVTCGHILWGLAHDVKFQDELARDLAIAGWPTGLSQLEGIPRLRAAVKEGIRWAGAASAMLPRAVPEGGAMLAGKFIPGGVSAPKAGLKVMKLTSLDHHQHFSHLVFTRQSCLSFARNLPPDTVVR
jgi:hypothetical protein